MAPVEPDVNNSNLVPLTIFVGYLVNAFGITLFLAYFVLYRSYQSLPPSQATRLKSSNRQKHVRIFVALTILSLVITWYYMISFFWLSYRGWAYEMNEAVPDNIWASYSSGDGPKLALGRWLKDSTLFRDAWSIASEKTGRYWWTQQIFFVTAAWGYFLGVEGSRRNIPHLWAFMLLGQTVAISFAMNLFFLAVLLRPVSSAPRTTNQESPNLSRLSRLVRPLLSKSAIGNSSHHAHPLLYVAIFLSYFVGVLLVPFTASTAWFMPILLLPHVLVFAPLYLDQITPKSLSGPSFPHTIYRFISYCSIGLYAKQTVLALLDNDPGSHTHKHSAVIESLRLRNPEYHGPLDRSMSAVGRILGSLGDHPASASVGWDVILCGLSLIIWAAVRGLGVKSMTGNAGFNKLDVPALETGRPQGEDPGLPDKRHSGDGTSTASRGSVRKRKNNSNSMNGEITAAQLAEIESENLESAGIAYTLFVLGGLGATASGVFGAETMKP